MDFLADFGISSHQIDNKNRGFSTRFNSELDMRMNSTQKIDAKIIINDYDKINWNIFLKILVN